MRSLIGLAFVFVSGCMFGVGPVIGFGHHHGLVVGGEVAAGVGRIQHDNGQQVQLSLGITGPTRTTYLAAVAAIDAAGTNEQHGAWSLGGRLGGGLMLSNDDTRGMLIAGGNYARVWLAGSCDSRRSTTFVIWLDVRYLQEWQAVLAPRLETQYFGGCPGY